MELLHCFAVEGSRTILHVDMDAFFASVEVLDNPKLRGLPVLVGGAGRRGVVAAASYEARRFGCRSAQPTAIALRQCPQAIVVVPRHERYVEVSSTIFGIFRRFTPLVEGLSIDEAFLDVSGAERLLGTGPQIAQKIRQTVHGETGLTCSVGVASCKFIAKIASDRNKPDGLTVVPVGKERAFLAVLPIRKLWGVGPKTEESLRRLGIFRVGDIADAGEERLVEEMGEHGRHLYRLSMGIDERAVEVGGERKQIGHENTYGDDLIGRKAVERSLLNQSMRVADRLVRKGLRGRKVQVKLRDIDFNTWTRQCTLEHPTDRGQVIFQHACTLLAKLPVEGGRFRLTGVSVGELVSEEEQSKGQLSLLVDDEVREKAEEEARGRALQGVMTQLRDRFGKDALFPADVKDSS